MFIRVAPRDGTAEVRLEDAENFRQFHLVVDHLDDESAASAMMVANAGEYSADHAWVRRQFIEDHAPSTSAEWITQFAAMLEFAKQSGWMSSDGASIRAHVKRH